nr:hypothetical protein [Tanacetum cinerariifolium]
MAIFTSIRGRAYTISLLVHVLVFIRLRANVSVARGATPGLYVFGDSLVDVGNNNYLPLSLAKADYRPNGVDYSSRKSTGRFSNGKNAADFLGVSFASGASGIPNETGVNFVQYISLAQQVEYFTLVHNKLVQQLGQSGAQSHLSKSIFAVITGSNDLFSYFSVGSLVLSLVPKGVGAIGCCPILRKANRNPRSYGITEIREACCGLGNLHADVPCLSTSTYCLKRKKHVFWDQYHPTEVTASIFVDILYNGTQEYVVPINVKQLLDV